MKRYLILEEEKSKFHELRISICNEKELDILKENKNAKIIELKNNKSYNINISSDWLSHVEVERDIYSSEDFSYKEI